MIDQAESEKTPSAFVLSQAEIENELRKHGSGFVGGKQRIMTLYQTQTDRSLRAKALAKEYGIGGHSHDFLDGSRGFVNHDWKGLEFDHYPDHQKFTLKWAQVEQYIDLMIQSDRYLTDEEKEHYAPPAPVSTKPDADLTRAKNLIREFCQEEYDSEPDFSDLSKIDIAYTYATDEEIPIQVNVDLIGYRVERYLGDVLIDQRQYESLEELTETELEALDFSELVSVTDEELEHYHSKAEERPVLLPLAAATEYNTLKEQHPDALVGFEQNGQFEFYGEDARKVCELVGGKLLEKETALGTVPVTGFPSDQWAYRAKQLWQCGENVYLAGLNEDGTHHQTKYLRRKDYLPLGATVHMEGRAFRVDTVNFDKDSVSLQDVALAEMRMPVFRQEPLAVVRELYEQEQTEPELSDEELDELPISAVMDGKVQTFPDAAALDEALNAVPAGNFRITDDHLGEGGAKQKYARNIEAIRTLFKLEQEHRGATAEEQQVLSQYVGWGGLSDAFDPGKDSWAKEYTELKGLLSEDEYAAARSSTLNAHYTSPVVIRAIYDAVEKMGFKSGNILEPSMGVGNFFGMLPDGMADSRLYGVELDSITGRIAKMLYPQADITVAGFETTDRRDFYDLAVGKEEFCGMVIKGVAYDEKKTAGERLMLACSELPNAEEKVIGNYRGFELSLRFDAFRTEYQALLKGRRKYTVPLGNDPLGNIIRLDNSLNNFPERITSAENELDTLHQQQAAAQIEVEKPFPQEEELAEKSARLAELNAQLDVDEKSHEPEQEEQPDEDAPRRPSVLAALEEKLDKPEPVKPFKSYLDKDGDAR